MMNHKQATIIKSVGIGMAVVGGALGVAAAMKTPQSAKKGFHKALKTFSNAIGAF